MSDRVTPEKLARQALEWAGQAVGCGDSSCMFKRPSGMCTNGGCRCMKSPDTHELAECRRAFAALFKAMPALLDENERLRRALSEIAEGVLIDWWDLEYAAHVARRALGEEP